MKLSPEKWPRYKEAYLEWWHSLSVEEKVHYKAHFLKVREWNKTKNRFPYPDMYNLKDLRLSQLTNKHIYRIWVFRDHPENKAR